MSGGALESFVFNRLARFPGARPAEGDRAVWTAAFAGPTMTPEARLVSLFVPVRGRGRRARSGPSPSTSIPRRYVAQAVDRGGLPGDLWFATRRARATRSSCRRGPAISSAGSGEDTERLGDSAGPERRRLAAAALSGGAFDRYVPAPRASEHRLATARAPATGWVFVEGLSADRLARSRAEPGSGTSDGKSRRSCGARPRSSSGSCSRPCSARSSGPRGGSRRRSCDLVGRPRSMGRGHEVEVAGIESARRARPARRRDRPHGPARRAPRRDAAPPPRAPAGGPADRRPRRGAGARERGDRGLHAAPSGSGSSSTTRTRTASRPRGPAGTCRRSSPRRSSDLRRSALDREHGLQDRERSTSPTTSPATPTRTSRSPARRRLERDLRAAEDRGEDDRRRRRDQSARRIRAGGGGRADDVRRRGVAPHPERPALRAR